MDSTFILWASGLSCLFTFSVWVYTRDSLRFTRRRKEMQAAEDRMEEAIIDRIAEKRLAREDRIVKAMAEKRLNEEQEEKILEEEQESKEENKD